MHTHKALKPVFSSIFLTLATTGAAWAHTGADSGSHHGAFMDGLLHPLTGTDHLAAMVAVGIWSAVALRTAWQAPLAFVALLAVGALAGFAGFQPPGVEPAIAASIVVLGLLISWRKRLPAGGVVSLVGVFAFFHGVAHGAELAGGAQLAALAGMVVSTAGLHLAGVGMGRLALAHQQRVRQGVGAALTVLGTWLLMQAA
ncbi:MAG: HupE/UreJ family protein [Burkholderiaceae bacterium]